MNNLPTNVQYMQLTNPLMNFVSVQIMYLHEYYLHLNKQQTFCLVGFSVVCLDSFEANVSACLPSTLLAQL
jgi:hypothetical protein